MTLKVSGVRLVAEGYQTYMRQMQSINKAHEQAFSAEPGKKAARGSKSAASGVNMFSRAMSKAATMAKGLAVALVGVKFAQFARESANIAANNEALGAVLGIVGKNAGYTAEQIAFAEKSVKAMGITTSSARQALTQMAQANVEWSSASELARLAQDAARIAQINSSAAFERLITGIQRGNTIILKTMGLTVSFQQAYKKMAQELGTSTMALTDQQKVQARVNAVMEAGVAIQGAYEAGADTIAGKEKSLARVQEEALANWGELFKIIKSVGVELKTGFFKALGEVGEGVKSWAVILQSGLDALEKNNEAMKESETIGYRLGKAVHDLAGIFVIAAGRVFAFAETINQAFKFIGQRVEGFGDLLAGDFDAFRSKVEDFDFGETFAKNAELADARMKELYPTLLEAYKGAGDAAEVNMDRGTEAVNRQTAALKDQITALENRADVLKRVESIHLRFEKDIARANKERAKAIEEFNKQSAKREADLVRRLNERIQKLEQDAAKRELQMVQDAHRNRVQEERQRNMELEQERRRFQLSQMQGLRRFNLDQTRLAAEGDILGLIRLREDYAIQQQEAQENRNLELQEGREAADEQKRQEEEDLAVRLQRLRQQTEERRQELLEAHNRELTDLRLALVEQRAEIDIDHQERLASAREARDESLQDLGRALQEEGKLTEEGMTVIADEIGKVFGDDGAATALVEGWAARSTSAIGQTTAFIAEEIARLNDLILSLGETGMAPPSSYQGARGEYMRGLRPRGMREGGSGVVTGPATFQVEPGVTEAFSFVPLAQQSVNVNMSGGFDIRGAEGASAGVVDASLERMVDTFEDVLERLASRRGR